MGQIVKADSSLTRPKPGEIKKSGHQLVYSQRKQLVKSNGSFTESHVGKTKRNGDRSEVLLTYSRRKKSGKSIGVRVNGFLVYTRKKLKFRGPFARRDLSETKKNGDQRSTVSSRELLDDTQVTEVTCSSDGTNDSCSSLKSSSEVNSTSSKSREDDCYSSDSGVSETDTDGSSSPFRQCKHCDKPGTVEKMLICDECEEAYHTRCCGVQMKDVAEIDEWLCPSCLKNQSSKTKNSKKQCSAVNWLQCREEDTNGVICGKWRRAPRSEVQTKDWECFCCFSWDPSRADCAVPQELETSEILKQLKYIKMLRPRSDAKKRKLGPKGRSRSHIKGKS